MYGEHPVGKCRVDEGEEGRRRRGCAQLGEKLVKSVGKIWRSWHRIDGGSVNSLRPYASLRVPQELID